MATILSPADYESIRRALGLAECDLDDCVIKDSLFLDAGEDAVRCCVPTFDDIVETGGQNLARLRRAVQLSVASRLALLHLAATTGRAIRSESVDGMSFTYGTETDWTAFGTRLAQDACEALRCFLPAVPVALPSLCRVANPSACGNPGAPLTMTRWLTMLLPETSQGCGDVSCAPFGCAPC